MTDPRHNPGGGGGPMVPTHPPRNHPRRVTAHLSELLKAGTPCTQPNDRSRSILEMSDDVLSLWPLAFMIPANLVGVALKQKRRYCGVQYPDSVQQLHTSGQLMVIPATLPAICLSVEHELGARSKPPSETPNSIASWGWSQSETLSVSTGRCTEQCGACHRR